MGAGWGWKSGRGREGGRHGGRLAMVYCYRGYGDLKEERRMVFTRWVLLFDNSAPFRLLRIADSFFVLQNPQRPRS